MQLQATLATPEGAPVAVGGAPHGDPCVLPSLSAATVLMAEGFHAVNLGAHTPLDTLLRAAEDQRAALVWLSVTHASATSDLRTQVSKLAADLAPLGARLVVGGYHHEALGLTGSESVCIGQSMAELAAFGKGLLAARAGKPSA
jgi:hypothetical protein